MPTAQVLLRDLIRDHIGPTLREHGYAGSGQHYAKRIGDNWAAINVQRSSSATADELSFTINLGTASTAVRIEDGFAASDPAREIDCHWRNRLGSLLPDGRDTWWTVTSRMRADAVRDLGSMVAAHLNAHGLPTLASMAADEAILAMALHGGEPAPGMTPADMDVVGPILRAIGPPARFSRYLEICDANGARAASLYELFDDPLYAPRLGPVRLRKRLDDLSRAGFEPRQQAITDLGYAAPTDEIKAALWPFLGDSNSYLRSAAAHSLGQLGDLEMTAQLQRMVREEPSRSTAVHAAFALAKLDTLLGGAERRQSRDAIGERRERGVGHDRAALTELLRRLADPSPAGGPGSPD